MAIVALISLVLRTLNYPMPPLILGFILGGMIEKNLRRALLINDGSFSFLWERPISLCLFILMILIVLLQIYQGIRKRQTK
jgi:putative tricarboxylic transport membrane protein